MSAPDAARSTGTATDAGRPADGAGDAVRPADRAGDRVRSRTVLLALLLLSVLLAGGVSYYASGSPDGLEKVATDQGIAEKAQDHDLAGSPLADYGVAGVDDARLSGGMAGLAGLAVTFVLATVLVTGVRRRGHAQGSGRTSDGSRGQERVDGGGRPDQRTGA